MNKTIRNVLIGGFAAVALSATVAVPVSMAAPEGVSTSYTVLKQNQQSTNVKALQHLLNGRHNAKLTVDGAYGAKTRAAVVSFQKANGLTPDGVAGKQTLTKLTPELRSGSKGSSVKALQTLLNKNGANLQVDGSYGPKTDAAVKSFAKAKQIDADLKAEKLWSTLFTSSGSSSGGGSNTGGGAGTYAGTKLSAAQVTNARTIIAVGKGHGFSKRGQIVAIATAMQESTLHNLKYGDRDSQGLFQQRPSMGWGSVSQITDPVMASRAFYGVASHTNNPGLKDIRGWESMSVTRAAQAVQRSGYPDAYAKWERLATELVERNQDVKAIK